MSIIPATDEVTHDTNANLNHLLDWVLLEFVQDPGEPPNHNNVPPEIEALYDPATYEYEYVVREPPNETSLRLTDLRVDLRIAGFVFDMTDNAIGYPSALMQDRPNDGRAGDR